MTSIIILPKTGRFAENKDVARDIRKDSIIPLLEANKECILDFNGVDSATQSFIHALISDVIRTYGVEVLDRVLFKNCSETVQKIITIVVEYMQESEI
jgi:hypothetical protein